MSTAHDDWPPSPISSASLSPATTANFTDSATLEFVNVTEEEAMTGLTSVRSDKAHSDDKTSERQRVAHNAVERQRRGDLNKRILDLASLLCMVKPDHRLTRTVILNSVIAHLHAARRHSALAAQELRMIENENEALRREVNEWRAYAGVTCLDEPVRSEALETVLCDEFNVLDGVEAGVEAGVKASAMARDRNVDIRGVRQDAEPECAAQHRQGEGTDNMATQMEGCFANPIINSLRSTDPLPPQELQNQPEAPLPFYYPSSTIDSCGHPMAFENSYQQKPQPWAGAQWTSSSEHWESTPRGRW